MNRCWRHFWRTILFVGLFLPGAVQGAEVYLPHITGTGGIWGTYLQVDNNHLLPASFTLTLYDDGQQVSQDNFTVDGLSESVIDLKNVAPSLASGSGMITYSNDLLNFRLSYENNSGGGVAEFRLSDERDPILGFYFSDFSSEIAWKAIAVTNLNAVSAGIKLYALGNGRVLGSADMTLAPYSKSVGFYTTWFPGVAFNDIKKIIAVSPVALCGVTISGSADSSLLLFTAAAGVSSFDSGISISDDYTGTWRGTWQSLDYPMDSGEVTFHINQSGDSFTGTTDVTDTDCGDVENVPINGTVSGNTITINGTYNCQGNVANLAFTNAKVVLGVMSGVYQEYVNGEYYDQGIFSAAKE